MQEGQGNLERLYDAGLVTRDLPSEYADVIESLPQEHIDVIIDVVERLDKVSPEDRFEPVWGRRWWSVYMTF